ncbi:MAG: CoA-binding protein [Chloroflexota bacterium]
MTGKVVEELYSIFGAKSVAIIGASNDMRKWGGRMVQRLLLAKYAGDIYPVNLKEEKVQGLRAYRSVLDLPDTVELAAIAIPAELVPQALRECAQKKVKGAAIITADFAETGSYGRALQDEIVAIARQGGIRIIGPNCQGLWNSANHLNLALSSVPDNGAIAILSQSGNFSHIFADYCISRGYGVGKVVSMGNQADLDVADYLEFLADDPETRAVFAYMEGCHDGRKLFRALRETVRKKPVVAFKSARNPAVARVAASHTAAIAGQDRIFEAMFKQAGVIRSDDLFSSLSMAVALTQQPSAKGNRIALMGTGGQGVVLADACVTMGMEIPQIADNDIKFILEGVNFPPQAPPPRNPVDFAGGGPGSLVEAKILNRLAQLDYINGIIANQPALPPAVGSSPTEQEQAVVQIREYLTAIPQKYGKPLLFMHLPGFPTDAAIQKMLADAGILTFPTCEEAVRTMYALVSYGQIKRRDAGNEEASR